MFHVEHSVPWLCIFRKRLSLFLVALSVLAHLAQSSLRTHYLSYVGMYAHSIPVPPRALPAIFSTAESASVASITSSILAILVKRGTDPA